MTELSAIANLTGMQECNHLEDSRNDYMVSPVDGGFRERMVSPVKMRNINCHIPVATISKSYPRISKASVIAWLHRNLRTKGVLRLCRNRFWNSPVVH